MKFLCDQCKAKYQISDDKVAGKTVRMKCRKCGHQIEVRAAVTETSVSTAFPSELPPPNPPAAGSLTTKATAGAPTAPKVPPAPRPSTLATSLSAAARPAPPRPQQGALAGAFKSTVQKEDEALLDVSTTDEWYVAINGVPVGPVRIAELRRKAALGAVTDESLVWQEGMEEWRIVRQIPELQAIVREAATSGRVSLLSPEPPAVKPASQPPQSMRPAPMRSVMPPRAPAAPPAPGRSNVVPITSRLATAEKLEEIDVEPDVAHDRLSAMPDPFAVPPSGTSAAAGAGGISAPVTAAQAPIVQTVEAKKSPPWIILGMLFMFTAFGVTAALVFKPQPPAPVAAPQPVIIQMPATPQPTAAPAPTDSAGAVASADPKKPGGQKVASAAPAASNKPAVDLSGLNGTAGAPAKPDLGLGGLQNKGGVGGTQLTQDQIEGVVRSHMLGLRRTCWERGASNSSAANITAAIKINGTGQVSDVTSTGNDPVVGKCIEGDIRHWQFPPTGAATPVNIPFHFVRQ